MRILSLAILLALVSPSVFAGVVGAGYAGSCTQTALETALAAGGDVTFNCGANPAIIKLSKDLAQITVNVNINGGNLITLDGQGKYRILHTAAGRLSSTGEKDIVVSVSNITLKNGYTTERGGAISMNYFSKLYVKNVEFYNNVATRDTQACDGGGAIWLDAENTTVIENSVFIGNKANNGGGVNTVFSDVIIRDSYFERNEATHTAYIDTLNGCGGGGAVRFEGTRKAAYAGTGKMLIERCTFVENTTNHAGGALEVYLYDDRDTLDVNDSYFLRNKSTKWGQGGAIAYMNSKPGQGLFTLRNSTVAYNHSDMQGGGVYVLTNTDIINSTIVGNRVVNPDSANIATKDQWRRGFGAGIRFADPSNISTHNVVNTTIAYNYAEALGGGVKGGGTNATFKNSIIANNQANNTYKIQINCIEQLKDGGNNIQLNSGLSGDKPCFANLASSDPLLETELRYAGSGVPILPLKVGSPAIDKGATASCSTYDARGVARKGTCDIGAAEYNPSVSTLSTLKSTVSSTGVSFSLSPSNQNRGKSGYVYAAFLKNGILYFLDEYTHQIGWGNKTVVSAATNNSTFSSFTAAYGLMPFVASSPAASTFSLKLTNDEALTLFKGASAVYVGYARNQMDMINNFDFACAFKIVNNVVTACE